MARWRKLASNDRLREKKGRNAVLRLHDGPPYANGHLHHRARAEQDDQGYEWCAAIRYGFYARYIPVGIATVCPIEWKDRRRIPPKKVKTKTNVPRSTNFRAECPASLAETVWVDVAPEEIQTPWHHGQLGRSLSDDGFSRRAGDRRRKIHEF